MAGKKTRTARPIRAQATPSSPPLRPEPNQSIPAAAVFLISLALYLTTIAPTVTLVDSGELIVAARTLSIAHPPGVPLYVLLAHAATWLPLGNMAVRVHLLSAVFAALSAGILTLLASEALMIASRTRLEKASRPQTGKVVAWLPPLASGLLFSVSRTVWSYATVAEVYTLNTFLVLATFFAVFRWRRLKLELPAQHELPDQWLNIAALLFGLSLCVHHVTAGLTLPALAFLVLSTKRLGFLVSKSMARAAMWALLGLTPYLYLPIAASLRPLFNWGDPSHFGGFWRHVTGWQYQVFFQDSERLFAEGFDEFLTFLLREFGQPQFPLALMACLFGLWTAYKLDKKTFVFLVLVIFFNLAYSINYEIAEDKESYYLPTFATAAMAIGFAAHSVVTGVFRSWRLKKPSPGPVIRILAAVMILATPPIGFVSNLPYNNRSRYLIAQDYVHNITGTVGQNGTVLTVDWQVYSPALYFRELENYRPDVVFIDVNLLRRSWYFDYLERAYPQLIGGSREKVDLFLGDLRHWENDQQAFARDSTLQQRINSRFLDMIAGFINSQINSGPVFVTQEIGTGSDGQNGELARLISAGYQLVPHGLVFKLVRQREFQEPIDAQLQLRGLADGSLKFDEGDVVRQKVIPAYASMMTNRGIYLAAQGRHQEAVSAFESALSIDPEYQPAKRALDQSMTALQKAR